MPRTLSPWVIDLVELIQALVGGAGKSSGDDAPGPAPDHAPMSALEPYVRRGSVVVAGGVRVKVREVAGRMGQRPRFAEVKAAVRGSLGPRLLRVRGWEQRPLPGLAIDIPAERDAITESALPALDATWQRVLREVPHAVLACDGSIVVAWIDEPESPGQIDALIEAVAATARWDASLAANLAGLPEATLLAEDDLSPGVSLAPDGLRIGVRAGELIAELDGLVRPIGRARPGQLAVIEELREVARGASPVGPYR